MSKYQRRVAPLIMFMFISDEDSGRRTVSYGFREVRNLFGKNGSAQRNLSQDSVICFRFDANIEKHHEKYPDSKFLGNPTDFARTLKKKL